MSDMSDTDDADAEGLFFLSIENSGDDSSLFFEIALGVSCTFMPLLLHVHCTF